MDGTIGPMPSQPQPQSQSDSLTPTTTHHPPIPTKQVPKVDAKTLAPAEWPTNRQQEWCPPGHGDLYAALAGSGTLDRLLADGVKYMFVSNSDNLGATLDLALLTHFAESGSSFMMECAERTEADKKGGHLAVRAADGQLILRESAQCAKEDEAAFQDVGRHKCVRGREGGWLWGVRVCVFGGGGVLMLWACCMLLCV